MSHKEESKTKDDVVTVNVDEFTRTRDSVIISLAQLQSAVSDLSRAYINHANTVLNRGPSNIDFGALTGGITNTLYESGLLGPRPASPGAKSEAGGDGKKKRKRAPPDPNAPKRALTPFFLFMQHNRRKIAEEMGPTAKPKEVSDEGTRRWGEMPEANKEVWKKLYADNLAVYKEKVKAYKAGLPFSDDDNTRAANQLQQDVEGISASGAEESEENEDDDQQEEEEDEDEDDDEEEEEEEEEEESSPEPVREPTPPRSGKRRRSEIKSKEVSILVAEKKESPEKKKRVSARKGVEKEDAASARKPASGDTKRSKKKRKSEVNADE